MHYLTVCQFTFIQIAQVHRATLLNGQEVVVKVQHEGIKKVILEVGILGFMVYWDEKVILGCYLLLE